jgi:membrane-associated protease RseP (regulator of RpoE activity)
LLVIAGLLAALAIWNIWAFVFASLLIVCIFLHELGHFTTARLTGMKVTQFFLFMGPKLYSFRRGEVEYGVRAYPVGAFVRIVGMNNLDDVDPADEPRTYRSKSYPRRMLVITAGSLMHLLIAVALLFGVYSTKGQLKPDGRVLIGTVVAGAPAAQAGVKPDDVVLFLEDAPISSATQFVDLIHARRPGDTVRLVVERDRTPVTLQVTLGTNPNAGASKGLAYLGTSSGDENSWQGMAITTAARRSVTDLGTAAWDSVGGIVKVLNPVNIWRHVIGSNTDPTTQPTTVIGVTRFSSTVGHETGIGGVLIMLAGVNVFVGLLNLFPMLPFDGGHAAVATYERIRSRKGRPPYRADVGKLVPVAMAMMAVLAFLLVAGLYLDVTKPLK